MIQLAARRRRAGIDLPLLELAFSVSPSNAVALLNLADQLLGATLDLVYVIVGQLSPFLTDSALELSPLTLENVLVHFILQSQPRMDGVSSPRYAVGDFRVCRSTAEVVAKVTTCGVHESAILR